MTSAHSGRNMGLSGLGRSASFKQDDRLEPFSDKTGKGDTKGKLPVRDQPGWEVLHFRELWHDARMPPFHTAFQRLL